MRIRSCFSYQEDSFTSVEDFINLIVNILLDMRNFVSKWNIFIQCKIIIKWKYFSSKQIYVHKWMCSVEKLPILKDGITF